MYKRDGMSATEYLTYRVRSGRLEPDYEQTPWGVWTAECGFFSAACLQRLFLRESFGSESQRKISSKVAGR